MSYSHYLTDAQADAFGHELDAIRDEVRASLGATDAAYIRRMIRIQRSLDLGGMTAHLAAKHAWVDALADDDHVARMRVHGLHSDPGRLDELITEIAMGRSIVEG